MFFLALVRPGPRRTYSTCWRRGVRDHDLVATCGVLLRRRIPGQCCAALRQTRNGAAVPDSVRETPREGSLVLAGECPLGAREFWSRVLACVARRELRPPFHDVHLAVRSRCHPHQPVLGTALW